MSSPPQSSEILGQDLKPATRKHYDLISFLSLAQKHKVDFLPITWQSALGALGKGGTANVSQSMINIETSFAFKRMDLLGHARSADPLQESFERLISELCVLRNPSLLAHPNIVDLEGICWEVHTGSEDALPVLVLKKAEFGDLDMFLDYGTIEEDSFSVKVGLCVDIANAILALHESSMFLASWTVI
jgi:Protein tyrosine and serine/threonine kinase